PRAMPFALLPKNRDGALQRRYGSHDAGAIARMQPIGPGARLSLGIGSRCAVLAAPAVAWNHHRIPTGGAAVDSAPLIDTVPVTLLTGFLGSGKTTLLRRVLSAPEFSDTAVVVNEAGEISIDHYLIDFVEGEVVELPSGCLCCAVREDLAAS